LTVHRGWRHNLCAVRSRRATQRLCIALCVRVAKAPRGLIDRCPSAYNGCLNLNGVYTEHCKGWSRLNAPFIDLHCALDRRMLMTSSLCCVAGPYGRVSRVQLPTSGFVGLDRVHSEHHKGWYALNVSILPQHSRRSCMRFRCQKATAPSLGRYAEWTRKVLSTNKECRS